MKSKTVVNSKKAAVKKQPEGKKPPKGESHVKYSSKLADKICGLLAQGLSVHSVCLEPKMPCPEPKMPCPATIFNWLRTNKKFREMYELAKEESADCLADELLAIADNASNDWMERNDEDNPGWQFNGDHVQRDKLRIDTRKWLASKLKPKKYGEKIDVEHSGEIKMPDLVKPVFSSKKKEGKK